MDHCGRAFCTFMVFCFFRHENCIGKFPTACNSSIQICSSWNHHVVFCICFSKTKMANRQAMEAGNHIRLTKYNHLFGLLYYRHATHHCRDWRFVRCH